jgi:hypothetical protein
MAAKLSPAADAAEVPDGVRVLAWLERRLLRRTIDGVDVLADFPPAWAGQGVEVYKGQAAELTVAYALRWHGERPALLWELSRPVRLTCRGLDPHWWASSATGEALLAPYRS